MGKRLKMNINTEKKLIKEVTLSHETERKSFETKMKVRNLQGFDNDNRLAVFWIRIQLGQRIWIQAGRNGPPKEENIKKIHILRVWMSFVRGFRRQFLIKNKKYFPFYKFLYKFCHNKSWSGSGSRNRLDPDSAKYQRPDSVNTDPTHCPLIS